MTAKSAEARKATYHCKFRLQMLLKFEKEYKQEKNLTSQCKNECKITRKMQTAFFQISKTSVEISHGKNFALHTEKRYLCTQKSS